MDKSATVMVAGARGLVGGALVRRLAAAGYSNLLTPARAEVDLRDPVAVDSYFAKHRPQYLFIAAAKVGGIHANNTYPGDFLRENLQIQLALIEAARKYKVQKLLFLGSSCIYPKLAPQPIPESALLCGALEPTNSAYAVAKIAGIEMVAAYRRQYGLNGISAMPTNLYGPGDNYDLQNSHVLPALIRKVHEARLSGAPTVTVWGTGTVLREFLFVDDLADACLFLMNSYEDDRIINVGSGEEITIRGLAETVVEVLGFQGQLVFDTSKPDGTPRKLLDVARINALGWRHQVSLRDGIRRAYEDFLQTPRWHAAA
ncbi:MAG: GDP-L-fucose synthase [Alphaproteobacteria bacterium]|nr:GDP-L-fucose synthase [Alphaproteobacteria bacterium]